MTWEYSGAPATSPKDAVRFLLGDTDPADPQMEDEEIDYLVSTHGSTELAAAYGCEALAGKYARAVTKSVGDLSIQLSDRAKAYREQASRLFLSATGSASPVPAVAPYFGGQSFDEADADADDTDLVHSEFTIGMHDEQFNQTDRRRRRSEPDYGST